MSSNRLPIGFCGAHGVAACSECFGRYQAKSDPRDATIARLREELTQAERDAERDLTDRDEAVEWADRLAYAIAPLSVIGEHSSLNNPWANALTIATSLAADLAALRATNDSLKTHDASSVSNWEFALIERDAAREELAALRGERDVLLDVARLYVNAFTDDDLMTLPEKLRYDKVVAILAPPQGPQ